MDPKPYEPSSVLLGDVQKGFLGFGRPNHRGDLRRLWGLLFLKGSFKGSFEGYHKVFYKGSVGFRV